MLNRIRDIRRQKGWTLSDLALACDPPTTAQTIGRLETGTRNLSLRWLARIATALGVEPELLLRTQADEHPKVIATLGPAGPIAARKAMDALMPTDLGGAGALMVLAVDCPQGEYRAGDQLWLRRMAPEDAGRALNRDVLVPRPGGRYAFGRLIDRREGLLALLPPGHGYKQEVVRDPPWLAVGEMVVRPL